MIYSDFFHQRQSYCMLHFLGKVKPFPPCKQLDSQSTNVNRKLCGCWVTGVLQSLPVLSVVGRWTEKPKIQYFRLNE